MGGSACGWNCVDRCLHPWVETGRGRSTRTAMPAGHWRRRCCRAVGCLLPSQTAAREGGTRESGDCTLFRKTGEALVSRLTRASPRGVSDGARTRDTQDHNLVLYQLSYTHHVRSAHAPGTGATIPEPSHGPAPASGARLRGSRGPRRGTGRTFAEVAAPPAVRPTPSLRPGGSRRRPPAARRTSRRPPPTRCAPGRRRGRGPARTTSGG